MVPGQVLVVGSASCLSLVIVAKLARLDRCPMPALLAPPYAVFHDAGAGCSRELFCLSFMYWLSGDVF